MNFKRWRWIDDVVLPLAVLALRLCWIWPWAELIRRWISPQATLPYLPLAALVVIGAGGYAAARWALRGNAIDRRNKAVVIGLGLVALLIALWLHYLSSFYPLWDLRWLPALGFLATDWSWGPPPVFIALLLGVALWVQGVRNAAPLSRHEQIWSVFTIGFAAFVLMLLLVQLDERGLPPGTGMAIWLFFGLGMAALALSALEYAGLGQTQEGPLPGMSRYWLSSMALVVGAILGIGVLMTLILAPETIAAALGSLRFLMEWLGAIIGAVLVVVAYLLFLVIEPLFLLLQQYMQTREVEEDVVDTASLQEMMEDFGADPASVLPPAVVDSLPWAGLLLILLALAIAVAVALRVLRRSPEESFVEARESIFSTDLLQEQLASLWGRFSGDPGATGPDPFLSLQGEEARRQTIRAIYQEFLAQMQAAGHPRTPPLTPVAYGSRLSATWPDRTAAIRILTDGYMQARYGDAAPTPDEVDAVRRAWEQLRQPNEPEPT